MKKRYFLFILFLFLIIASVSASDNNITSDNSTLSIYEDSPSENSDIYESPKIQTNDLVKYYKNDSQFEFKVSKLNDIPVSNASVLLKVNGINYTRNTNDEGVGRLTIGLNPGIYIITTSYKNVSVNNTIKVLSRFKSKDITSFYGKETEFSLTVLDKKGDIMKNQTVTFKVAGKTYKRNTDSNGVATLKLNLNANTYVIYYSTDGILGKNKYTVKNAYKIAICKWKSGGDITKNKLIKKNIPNSALVKKLVLVAKFGTPLIKFKGGKGKAVFITAGVHGNELSSQIAAMDLIQYLEKNPIRGTVYIMPFIHPKATAKNVRDYGVKLNFNANKKGTISYKTVKLITTFKCNAYGDFHCTQPGGNPGKNVAMGTYKPTAESAKLAKYIAKNSKVAYMIYKKAGVEYPGALEDQVSLKGIPAVTCEVKTPHGTIAKGSVAKSLSMMKSFLKYGALI